MAVEHIKETDTLNQGRVIINAILDQSNASVDTVNGYRVELTQGITDAKKIADDAGKEAVRIATEAGEQANETAEQALANSQTAITTADRAVSTANNNKQEFDSLRNDFDKLVAESGDSNPEIAQARTDTQGITRPTLATRLQVDFNERMTNAEGISLFTGSTNIKKMMDFTSKTAGNIAVNPHKYFSDFTATTLKRPADVWNEVSQSDYNKLASRDDSGVITGSTQNGVIPQQLATFDAVEEAKRLTPQMYEGLDRTQSATLLKDNFASFAIGVRAKATSPNNKNIKIATYLQSTNSWTNQIQENATEYSDFTVQVNDKNFITNDGYIHLVSYVDASNGVSSSSVDTDYCGVQIELSVNAQKVLEKSGFAQTRELTTHTSDKNNPHSVTKEQVGLSNVANYSFASDSEAVVGTSTSKYMHPKNVADAIKGQAVTQSGDQEINGTKDFKDGLKLGGFDVLNSKVYTQAIELGFGLGGTLKRIGKTVVLSVASNQTRARGDAIAQVGEKVPDGYKPNMTVSGSAAMSIGTSFETARFLSYNFGVDGSMTYYSKNMGASPITVNMTVSWITDDALPG